MNMNRPLRSFTALAGQPPSSKLMAQVVAQDLAARAARRCVPGAWPTETWRPVAVAARGQDAERLRGTFDRRLR